MAAQQVMAADGSDDVDAYVSALAGYYACRGSGDWPTVARDVVSAATATGRTALTVARDLSSQAGPKGCAGLAERYVAEAAVSTGTGAGSATAGGTSPASGAGDGAAAPVPPGDGTYVNSDGQPVPDPVQADTPPAGATARCNDGTYSFSRHRSGTCSRHGGVAMWL